MKQKTNSARARHALILIALIFCYSLAAQAQTSTFTYQGRLNDSQATGGSGSYLMKFELYADSFGATLVDAVADVPVTVSGNVFTVQLNFTAANAFGGTDRFLKISVKRTANEAYTALNPLQQITSVPYSIKSKTADTAQNALAIGGTAANQIIKEGDTRLSDSRQPTAGSPNYIQNTNAAQTATFNINGNGVVGGALSGNSVNSQTDFKINNVAVLKLGTDSIFAGANSGVSTTGVRNAFFGNGAGFANSTGQNNSFVGFQAGNLNTVGSNNSFTGTNAGLSNTTGSFNSYLGMEAGAGNTQGSRNSFVGAGAGQNNRASYNTFVGAGAGKLNTDAANNTFVGSFTGESNTTGSNNSFFGGGGPGFGGAAGGNNTSGEGNSFFGAFAGYRNTIGSYNTIIGTDANVSTGNLSYATAIGAEATVSNSNSVVLGRNLDTVRIPGNLNLAGTFTGNFTVPAANVTGTLAAAQIPNLDAAKITSGTFDSARLGVISIANGGTGSSVKNFVDLTTNQTIAGTKTFTSAVDTTAQYNINQTRVLGAAGAGNLFIGFAAGEINTGNNNLFVGSGAGEVNATGSDNSIVGAYAGGFNSTGSNNSFFGRNAGDGNMSGNGNSFFGWRAGLTNSTGGNNTIIGTGADVGSDNLSFAAAIGAGAVASRSNSITLGRAGGSDTLIVPGNFELGLDLRVGKLLAVNMLGTLGDQPLCRNSANQVISTCSSSLRYKTNISPFTSGLSFINRLQPISYDWKTGGRRDIGFGAEAIAAIDPLFVTFNGAGEVEGVKYDRLSVAFVNAFKEQQTQIETLEKQNRELKTQIEAQQNQLQNQQLMVDNLRRLVCSQNPKAELCR